MNLYVMKINDVSDWSWSLDFDGGKKEAKTCWTTSASRLKTLISRRLILMSMVQVVLCDG